MRYIVSHTVNGKSKSMIEDFTRTPWEHRPTNREIEGFFVTKKDNVSIIGNKNKDEKRVK